MYKRIHKQTLLRPPRAGFTLLEVSVAATMLVALLASSVHVIALLAAKQKMAERRAVAMQAAQNYLEQLESLPWEQVTAEAATRWPLPESVRVQLPQANVLVAVVPEAEPVAAKRVRIELSWNEHAGRPGGPVRLTTWIFPDAATQ